LLEDIVVRRFLGGRPETGREHPADRVEPVDGVEEGSGGEPKPVSAADMSGLVEEDGLQPLGGPIDGFRGNEDDGVENSEGDGDGEQGVLADQIVALGGVGVGA